MSLIVFFGMILSAQAKEWAVCKAINGAMYVVDYIDLPDDEKRAKEFIMNNKELVKGASYLQSGGKKIFLDYYSERTARRCYHKEVIGITGLFGF